MRVMGFAVGILIGVFVALVVIEVRQAQERSQYHRPRTFALGRRRREATPRRRP